MLKYQRDKIIIIIKFFKRQKKYRTLPVTGKELFTCRDVLWFLVFYGFAINYMLRLNLNLTIVAMVLPHSKPTAVVQCNVENSTLLWTNETSQNNNVSSSFSITKPSSENVTVF